MSCRFLFACIAAVSLGLGCSSDEPASPVESAATSEPAATPEPAVAAVDSAPVAADSESASAPAQATAPEGDGSSADSAPAGGGEAPAEDIVEGRDFEATAGSRGALGWETAQPGSPPEGGEGEVAPVDAPVVEKYVDPEGGGSVEPPADPNEGKDGFGHPSADSALNGVAKLMAGDGFRWLQGSKDVAEGFYGIPVLLTVSSCKDKNFKGFAKWLTGLESKYSDHMVGVLVASNESDRSLGSGDDICGLTVRPVRSHGIDMGGAVIKRLGAKRTPAAYVYNELGELVASHVGSLSAGSTGAKKIEAAFRPLMAPILQLRRASSRP